MEKKWGGYSLAVLSGLMLVGCYPPFGGTSLIWVALIPILFGVGLVPRESFRLGYVMGLIYFGGTFWWIGHVTVLGTVALVAYLSLYPGLWCWWLQRFFVTRPPSSNPTPAEGNRLQKWFRPWRETLRGTGEAVLLEESLTSWKNLVLALAAACSWVAIEWWRGWFLSGFGWNNLGLAFYANGPMRQVAAVGGVHLLSWLAVFINATGALTLRRFYIEAQRRQPHKPHLDFSVALILLALSYVYGFRALLAPEPATTGQAKFTCVQANIPQEVKIQQISPEEILQKHLDLSVFARNNQSDILLWPETALGLGIFQDPALLQAVQKISVENPYYFVLGSSLREQGKVYNAALALTPGGQDLQIYRKNKLVIFGEYVPLESYLPFLTWFVPYVTGCSSGPGPDLLLFEKVKLRAAPLICFEDTSPSYVRAAGRLNPDLLLNLTNDGWFKDSPGATQHLANAIFRTVELDLPLLRCTNTGITCLISRRGEILSELKDPDGKRVEIAGVLSGVVKWGVSRVTPYEKYGEWIVLLSACVAAIFTLRRWRVRS
jgi:apolipoprotein N-acyltransferase